MQPSEKRPPAQRKAAASLLLGILMAMSLRGNTGIVAREAESASEEPVMAHYLLPEKNPSMISVASTPNPFSRCGWGEGGCFCFVFHCLPPIFTDDLHLLSRAPLSRASAMGEGSGGEAGRKRLHTAAPIKVIPPRDRVANILPVVDQNDIRPHHRLLADQALRALPSFCRDHLQNFYVLYEKNPKNRGLGGASTIIVTGNVPDKEFMALVTHECGHVTDLGGIRGNPAAGESAFRDGSTPIYADDPSVEFYRISWLSPTERRKNARDTDFVSGYAASDPFEDFAEAFAYYALQQKEFKRLAAKNPVLRAKYQFMEQIVFAETEPIADGSHIRGKRVPWDVTKLPYTWHAKR